MNGDAAITYALSLIGKIPYKFGYRDCSWFIESCFYKEGINLPRTADWQYFATQNSAVDLDDIQRADLLFFGGWIDAQNPAGYAGIQHVGLAISSTQFVEEGGATQNVNVSNISEWRNHLFYATRPYGGVMIATEHAVVLLSKTLTPATTLAGVDPNTKLISLDGKHFKVPTEFRYTTIAFSLNGPISFPEPAYVVVDGGNPCYLLVRNSLIVS